MRGITLVLVLFLCFGVFMKVFQRNVISTFSIYSAE